MSSIGNLILVVSIILIFSVLGILIYQRNNVFLKFIIKNELLRIHIVFSLLFMCFYMALMPFYPGTFIKWLYTTTNEFWLNRVAFHLLNSVYVILIPVNGFLFFRRWLVRLKTEFSSHNLYAILFICISSALGFVLYNYISAYFYQDVQLSPVLILSWSVLSGGIVSSLHLASIRANAEKEKQAAETEMQIAKLNVLNVNARLQTLEAQVNPHFLYNTLGSVAELAYTNGKKAGEMAIALAELLRHNISRSLDPYTTISEEIELVKNYILIEKIRFEGSLIFMLNAEEAVLSEKIPRFILQPLAENAIKHGLKTNNKAGIIKMEIKGSKKEICILASDNGEPFPEDLKPGYGISSIMEKMSILYPGRYSFTFENTPIKQLILKFRNE